MIANTMNRLLFFGVLVTGLVAGALGTAYAAGNYYGDEIVWSKSEQSTDSWRIWKVGDVPGAPQGLLTQYVPAGQTDEHPVWSDDGTQIVFVRDNQIMRMDTVVGEAGGLTLLAPSFAHHPFVFGPKVYYVTRNGSAVQEIWSMDLADGSNKQSVLTSGSSDLENKWYPTVATWIGKDYLVYEQGTTGSNNNKIMIYNLTDAAGPALLDDGTSLPVGEDFESPSITPDGQSILFARSRGSQGRWEIAKRNLVGDPMDPNDGDFVSVLTSNSATGKVEMVPYADFPASSEMNFIRGVDTDGEIFHKIDLTTTTPIPANLTNDAQNVDGGILDGLIDTPWGIGGMGPVVGGPFDGRWNLGPLTIAGLFVVAFGIAVLAQHRRKYSARKA